MEKIQPILNDAILSFLADCAQNPILKTSILASIWTQKEKEKRQKGRRNCLESIQRSLALNGIVVKSQSALCT